MGLSGSVVWILPKITTLTLSNGVCSNAENILGPGGNMGSPFFSVFKSPLISRNKVI